VPGKEVIRVPKLKPGAVEIDLATGGVYGDLDHCPLEDLLESAEALLSLLPKVDHKGLWGLHKDFDADCYVYTTARSYEVDAELTLEADICRGPGEMPGPWTRPFSLMLMASSDRKQYWRFNWYSKLIGSVRDGQISPDIGGIPDLTTEQRAEHERWLAQCERNRSPVQTTLSLL